MPHPVYLSKCPHLLPISYSASRTSVGILGLKCYFLDRFLHFLLGSKRSELLSEHHCLLYYILYYIIPDANPCTFPALLAGISSTASYFHVQEVLKDSFQVNSPEVNFIPFFSVLDGEQIPKDLFFHQNFFSYGSFLDFFKWVLLTWMSQGLLARDYSSFTSNWISAYLASRKQRSLCLFIIAHSISCIQRLLSIYGLPLLILIPLIIYSSGHLG